MSDRPWKPARVRAASFAIVVLALLCGSVPVLHFSLDAFLVREGGGCPGCIFRGRRCIGLLRESRLSRGEEARCIGVPAGPWRCYREEWTEYDVRKVRMDCPPDLR